MKTYKIVHIEDDSQDFRAIPRQLRTRIRSKLDEQTSSKVSKLTKEGQWDSVFKYAFSWDVGKSKFSLEYYFVAAKVIDEVQDVLEPGVTFIIDAMRAGPRGYMIMSLIDSLASVDRYVNPKDDQIRIFTAYSEVADQIKDFELTKNIPKAPKIIMKTDRDSLYSYFMERIGLANVDVDS